MEENNHKTDLEIFFGEGGFDKDEVEFLQEQFDLIGIGIDGNDPDCLDNLVVADEGVYCPWCDSHFFDENDAIEVLKQDDNALYAAFHGHVTFEDRPYIENVDTSSVEWVDREVCEKLSEMKNYFQDNADAFKEIVEKAKLDATMQEPAKKTKQLKMGDFDMAKISDGDELKLFLRRVYNADSRKLREPYESKGFSYDTYVDKELWSNVEELKKVLNCYTHTDDDPYLGREDPSSLSKSFFDYVHLDAWLDEGFYQEVYSQCAQIVPYDTRAKYIEHRLTHGLETHIVDSVLLGDSRALEDAIEQGANVDYRVGESYLVHMALDSPETLKQLLEAGANVDAKVSQTALTQATRLEKIDTMKVLLEHGANPNIKDNGSTVLDSLVNRAGSWSDEIKESREPHAIEVATILLRHGAKTTKEFNSEGQRFLGKAKEMASIQDEKDKFEAILAESVKKAMKRKM